MNTIWFCDSCSCSGTISHDKNISVREAVKKIVDSHRLESPDCKEIGYGIRILTPSVLEAWKEWEITLNNFWG